MDILPITAIQGRGSHMSQSSRPLSSSRKVAGEETRSAKGDGYRTSLSKTTDVSPTTDPIKRVRRPWQAVFAGSPVLLLVLLLHILFGVIAAIFIVSSFTKERKKQFDETATPVNNAHRDVEHKVQMAKKKQSMTAPDIVQRIATADSPITLPEVDIPNINENSVGSSKIAGVGLGAGGGSPEHLGLDTGLIADSIFGLSDDNAPGLEGKFIELGKTSNGAVSKFGPKSGNGQGFLELFASYALAGQPEGFFSDYYTYPKFVHASQIMIPLTGPADFSNAFGIQIEPRFWLITYHGKFRVSKVGTYRFIGCGNNLVVQINGTRVLECSMEHLQKHLQQMADGYVGSNDIYKYSWKPIKIDARAPWTKDWGKETAFHCGPWYQFNPGETYDINVVMGSVEVASMFFIMVQEKDHVYPLTADTKSPILPVFKISNVQMPPLGESGPPYDADTNLGWTVIQDANSSSSQ